MVFFFFLPNFLGYFNALLKDESCVKKTIFIAVFINKIEKEKKLKKTQEECFFV